MVYTSPSSRGSRRLVLARLGAHTYRGDILGALIAAAPLAEGLGTAASGPQRWSSPPQRPVYDAWVWQEDRASGAPLEGQFLAKVGLLVAAILMPPSRCGPPADVRIRGYAYPGCFRSPSGASSSHPCWRSPLLSVGTNGLMLATKTLADWSWTLVLRLAA